jgi:hypothetical protein
MRFVPAEADRVVIRTIDRQAVTKSPGCSGRAPRCSSMQDFIHQMNLEHYRKLLAVTQDEAERKLLLKLLAEEKAKEPPPKMAVNDDEH